MITEDITRDLAEAQVSDDCRVELWVADLHEERTAMLTATHARALAAELTRAAGEAERAVAELLQPLSGAEYCASRSGDGYLCTRLRGHEGVHVVRTDPFAEPFAAWGGAS